LPGGLVQSVCSAGVRFTQAEGAPLSSACQGAHPPRSRPLSTSRADSAERSVEAVGADDGVGHLGTAVVGGRGADGDVFGTAGVAEIGFGAVAVAFELDGPTLAGAVSWPVGTAAGVAAAALPRALVAPAMNAAAAAALKNLLLRNANRLPRSRIGPVVPFDT
jgi:hypothetical protein